MCKQWSVQLSRVQFVFPKLLSGVKSQNKRVELLSENLVGQFNRLHHTQITQIIYLAEGGTRIGAQKNAIKSIKFAECFTKCCDKPSAKQYKITFQRTASTRGGSEECCLPYVFLIVGEIPTKSKTPEREVYEQPVVPYQITQIIYVYVS